MWGVIGVQCRLWELRGKSKYRNLNLSLGEQAWSRYSPTTHSPTRARSRSENFWVRGAPTPLPPTMQHSEFCLGHTMNAGVSLASPTVMLMLAILMLSIRIAKRRPSGLREIAPSLVRPVRCRSFAALYLEKERWYCSGPARW